MCGSSNSCCYRVWLYWRQKPLSVQRDGPEDIGRHSPWRERPHRKAALPIPLSWMLIHQTMTKCVSVVEVPSLGTWSWHPLQIYACPLPLGPLPSFLSLVKSEAPDSGCCGSFQACGISSPIISFYCWVLVVGDLLSGLVGHVYIYRVFLQM